MEPDETQDGSERPIPRQRHDGFSDERKQLFLVALRRGDSVVAACALVGVSSRTAYRHRERDPDFAEAWNLARRMSRTPLELAAFERGVTGIEEPVYRYGKLSHTRRRLSDSALMKLLAAEQPDKYGRAAGVEALLARFETRIEARVEAEVDRLGESLRGEMLYFVTRLVDVLAAHVGPLSEGSPGAAGAAPRPEGPKISPNPV